MQRVPTVAAEPDLLAADAGEAADRDGREGEDRRAAGEGRRHQEEQLVAARRRGVLLEEELDRVGRRLEQAHRAHAVGPDAQLDAGGHLALGEREVRRGGGQRQEHDDRLDEDHDDAVGADAADREDVGEVGDHRRDRRLEDGAAAVAGPRVRGDGGHQLAVDQQRVAGPAGGAELGGERAEDARLRGRLRRRGSAGRMRCTRPSTLVTVPAFSKYA